MAVTKETKQNTSFLDVIEIGAHAAHENEILKGKLKSSDYAFYAHHAGR